MRWNRTRRTPSLVMRGMTAVAVAVLVTTGLLAVPADAGHIDKGEGHGNTDPTIQFVNQPEVTEPSGDRCKIEFSYRVDDAKGKVSVWLLKNGVRQNALYVGLARELNGVVQDVVRTHENNSDAVTYALQLRDNKRNVGEVLATAEADPVTSTC